MQKGFITAQTFVARNAIPVPDVIVHISRKVDGGDTLLYSVTTDRNGKIPVLEIDAPDKSLSETPGYDGKPYALVDIKFSKEGFYTVKINDVQVFADRVTLQNVELQTIPENFKDNEDTVTYTVMPQNL